MKTQAVTVGLVMLAGFPAWAQQEEPAKSEGVLGGKFIGTATVASDYVFRGISQTDEAAAIQGGIEWHHKDGPFLGVWGSNVNFNDGNQASAEIDWYGGYAGTYRSLGYDARVIYYSYPGADTPRTYDFWELGLALTHEPVTGLTLTLGYNISPDYFNESGVGQYARAEAAYAVSGLPMPLKLSAGVARQFIEDNTAFGTPDYWTWSLGVATEVSGLSLGLTYSDTDIDKSRCGNGSGVCGARLIVNASYSF
ncbi:MAG: TorF family putative porin [Solirubrobacterales bacterium]